CAVHKKLLWIHPQNHSRKFLIIVFLEIRTGLDSREREINLVTTQKALCMLSETSVDLNPYHFEEFYIVSGEKLC
ncbi:hypothetical protein PFISCL1PPCAC_17443, partial [Pristionchus fissidentatus]